jgi:hypothetical protein
MGAGASEVTLPTGRVLPPFDGELLDGTWLSWVPIANRRESPGWRHSADVGAVYTHPKRRRCYCVRPAVRNAWYLRTWTAADAFDGEG